MLADVKDDTKLRDRDSGDTKIEITLILERYRRRCRDAELRVMDISTQDQ